MADASPPLDPHHLAEQAARIHKAQAAQQRPEREPPEGGKVGRAGFEFAVSILVCFGVGFWADHAYGYGPWGALTGTVLGFAAGCWRAYRMLADVGDGVGFTEGQAESDATRSMAPVKLSDKTLPDEEVVMGKVTKE